MDSSISPALPLDARGPACDTSCSPAQRWKLSDFAELSAIAGFLIAAAVNLSAQDHWSPRFGALVSYAAALILGQGLLRDLIKLAFRGMSQPTRKLRCLCGETSVGLALLAAGLGSLWLGIDERVSISGLQLWVGLAALLAGGFLIKDYVLVIERVSDHSAIELA